MRARVVSLLAATLRLVQPAEHSPVPRQDFLELAAWMRNISLQGISRLSRDQRLSNLRWVRRQDPVQASLLQVGANEHSSSNIRATQATYDVGPDCVSLGWRATLVEPMSNIFAQLAARYANETSAKSHDPHTRLGDRLTLVRGAVCENCSSTPPMRMWYVETRTNATGTWGSEHADNRCISAQHGPSAILSEIASLSRHHVLKQERYFQSSRRTCTRCSELLRKPANRPLPPNCLARVVSRNLRSTKVACYCPADLLQSGVEGTRGTTNGPATALPRRNLTLLLIDAEGHDATVLKQFPFELVRVSRVTFEAQHMPDRIFRATGVMLRSHGFELVYGGFKAPLSTWHHVNAA